MAISTLLSLLTDFFIPWGTPTEGLKNNSNNYNTNGKVHIVSKHICYYYITNYIATLM